MTSLFNHTTAKERPKKAERAEREKERINSKFDKANYHNHDYYYLYYYFLIDSDKYCINSLSSEVRLTLGCWAYLCNGLLWHCASYAFYREFEC